MVEFGETENLLDVLMQGAKSCDDGFIAEIHHSAVFYIACATYNFGSEKKLKTCVCIMHSYVSRNMASIVQL